MKNLRERSRNIQVGHYHQNCIISPAKSDKWGTLYDAIDLRPRDRLFIHRVSLLSMSL